RVDPPARGEHRLRPPGGEAARDRAPARAGLEDPGAVRDFLVGAGREVPARPLPRDLARHAPADERRDHLPGVRPDERLAEAVAMRLGQRLLDRVVRGPVRAVDPLEAALPPGEIGLVL